MSAFYRPCLEQSRTYDRAVGYFRSTIFAVVGEAITPFVQRGGRLRFVCSPEMDASDIEALDGAYEHRSLLLERLLNREIEALLSDASTAGPARVLATLVAIGALDLRIAMRPKSYGIYHEKLGIFADDIGNAVSFKGSANETRNGWHVRGNLESIEVFCSWRGGRELDRVRRHQDYFGRLWDNQIRDVAVVPFPEASKRRLCRVAHPSLEDIAELAYGRPGMRPRSTLKHQQDAIDAWLANGRRGIFQHATGSGKTFTAILAMREHTQTGDPALVVVPSTLLLDQWLAEIKKEMPSVPILLVGAGNTAWRQHNRLESFTVGDRSLGPRIVLATMQTACRAEFIGRVRDGAHLLLVADEVHQLGSNEYSQVLALAAGSRLGLSATPSRFGDAAGTETLMKYFGGVLPPVIELTDAIAAGRLVPYEYHPHAVDLTSEEALEWTRLSESIIREIWRSPRESDGSIQLSQRVKLLLIQRARIAKKAANKIPLARAILGGCFKREQRWLVYCEDLAQLWAVLLEIQAAGLPAAAYYSGMPGDSKSVLAWLTNFGGIVVSVRCLDEGVDIPEVTHALVLASSQNPRQFIQRRGRVLRTAPGKYIATIHDALVIPVGDQAQLEQEAMSRAEIGRAMEFARSAVNLDAAEEVAAIADRLAIPISWGNDGGFEDDGSEGE